MNGPDGRRQIAAGVLGNLGEERPPYRETTQQWLLIDLLTALRAPVNQRENLTHRTLEATRSHADDLWRSDHPATASTIEATAAVRDTDKALARQLRRSAHKARTRR